MNLTMWLVVGLSRDHSRADFAGRLSGGVFLSAVLLLFACEFAADHLGAVRARHRDQHTIGTSDFEESPEEVRTLFAQGCATLDKLHNSRAYREGWLGELAGSEFAAWCYADNLHRAHRLHRQTEEVKAAAERAGVIPAIGDAYRQYADLLAGARTELAHFTAAQEQAATITADLEAQDLSVAESRAQLEALDGYQRAQQDLDAHTSGHRRRDTSLAADLKDATSARLAGYRAVRS